MAALAIALDRGVAFRLAAALLVSVVSFSTVYVGVEHLVDRRLSDDEPDPSPGTNPLTGADQP